MQCELKKNIISSYEKNTVIIHFTINFPQRSFKLGLITKSEDNSQKKIK